jgi:hypothetical protein
MKRKVKLSNGKTIFLTYLSKEELDILLQVPTTVEQAKTIMKRNRILLSHYRNHNSKETYVGCPHCKVSSSGSYDCRGCAWQTISSKIMSKNFLPCLKATFGSATLFEVQASYGCKQESIYFGKGNPRYTTAFLMGHIEWARAVIALGGIAWPNGVMSSERQSSDKYVCEIENKPLSYLYSD